MDINDLIKRVEQLESQQFCNTTCDAMKAIPNGDADGHRRYHEAVIKKMEARAEVWLEVQKAVAKWGALGVVAWAATSMWHEAGAAISHLIKR